MKLEVTGDALLAGDILDGAVIRVGYADGELTAGYENPAQRQADAEHTARDPDRPSSLRRIGEGVTDDR
jgi:hypothetical protein